MPLFIDELTQEVLITGPQGIFEMIVFFLVFAAVAHMDMSVKSGVKSGGHNNGQNSGQNGGYNSGHIGHNIGHNGVHNGSKHDHHGDVGICYVSCTCEGGDLWVVRVHVTLPVSTQDRSSVRPTPPENGWGTTVSQVQHLTGAHSTI